MMKLRSGLAALTAAAALLFVGAGAGVAADFNPATPPTVTGCVIRFTAAGPLPHENSAHQCTGANSVEVEPDGDLLIRSDWQGPIVGISVDADETLVLRGIMAGASNGLGQTVIRFYDVDTGVRVRADSTTLVCDQCNIWVIWVHAGALPPPPPTTEPPATTQAPSPSTAPPTTTHPPQTSEPPDPTTPPPPDPSDPPEEP